MSDGEFGQSRLGGLVAEIGVWTGDPDARVLSSHDRRRLSSAASAAYESWQKRYLSCLRAIVLLPPDRWSAQERREMAGFPRDRVDDLRFAALWLAGCIHTDRPLVDAWVTGFSKKLLQRAGEAADDAAQTFYGARDFTASLEGYSPHVGPLWRYCFRSFMRYLARENAKIRRRQRQEIRISSGSGSGDDGSAELVLPSTGPSPEQALIDAEERQARAGAQKTQRLALGDCLDQLSAHDRELVVFRLRDGWTTRQLQDHFGLKENAARTRLYRARLDLRDCLRAKGFAL